MTQKAKSADLDLAQMMFDQTVPPKQLIARIHAIIRRAKGIHNPLFEWQDS